MHFTVFSWFENNVEKKKICFFKMLVTKTDKMASFIWDVYEKKKEAFLLDALFYFFFQQFCIIHVVYLYHNNVGTVIFEILSSKMFGNVRGFFSYVIRLKSEKKKYGCQFCRAYFACDLHT